MPPGGEIFGSIFIYPTNHNKATSLSCFDPHDTTDKDYFSTQYAVRSTQYAVLSETRSNVSRLVLGGKVEGWGELFGHLY